MKRIIHLEKIFVMIKVNIILLFVNKILFNFDSAGRAIRNKKITFSPADPTAERFMVAPVFKFMENLKNEMIDFGRFDRLQVMG